MTCRLPSNYYSASDTVTSAKPTQDAIPPYSDMENLEGISKSHRVPISYLPDKPKLLVLD